MRRFDRAALRRFLIAVDSFLEADHALIIIGGAAAVLEHGAWRATMDIDTANPVSRELERAVESARGVTGDDVPVLAAGVYDGPYCYEDRLLRVDLPLIHLDLWVPERHDLALMKIVRGYEHDLNVVAQIHSKQPLDLAVLVDRFCDEMKHVTKPGGELKLNFIALIELLYDHVTATRIEARLSDWDTV